MSKNSNNSAQKQCRRCGANVGYRNYCPPCQRINRQEFTENTCADCGKEISVKSVRCQPCRHKFTQDNAPKKYCKCGKEISIVSNFCQKCFSANRAERFEQESGKKACSKLPPPKPVEKPMYEWLLKQNSIFARQFGRLTAEQQRKAAESINITRRRFAKEQVTSGLSESIREILDDAKKNIYFCLELEDERKSNFDTVRRFMQWLRTDK